MIDLIGTGQLNGYPIKPMCSVLVNEWAFYGPYTTLPLYLLKAIQEMDLLKELFGLVGNRLVRSILRMHLSRQLRQQLVAFSR